MEIREIRQAAPGKMLVINGAVSIPDDPGLRAKYGVEKFIEDGGQIQGLKDDPAGDASARMQALERSQHRVVRELLLDPNDAAARKRLADLDADISELRGAR
jgi:hypothetical protein